MNKNFDKIHKAEHYNSHPSGIECIYIVRHHNFNIGNALKYLWRQGLKEGNTSVDDLNKAVFYILDEIKRLEGIPKYVEKTVIPTTISADI